MATTLPPRTFPAQQDRRSFEAWLEACCIQRGSHAFADIERGENVIKGILALEGNHKNFYMYSDWLREFVGVDK